jgi:hypothetical protein
MTPPISSSRDKVLFAPGVDKIGPPRCNSVELVENTGRYSAVDRLGALRGDILMMVALLIAVAILLYFVQ